MKFFFLSFCSSYMSFSVHFLGRKFINFVLYLHASILKKSFLKKKGKGGVVMTVHVHLGKALKQIPGPIKEETTKERV